MKHRYYLFVLILICLSSNINGIETNAYNPPNTDIEYTGDFALRKAILYTGFDNAIGFSVEKNNITVEKRIIYDSTYIFLMDSINSQQAWSVKFYDIQINSLKGKGKTHGNFPTTYEVLINAKTGKLIKITSSVLGEDKIQNSAIEPCMNEIYKKLPGNILCLADSLPKHTFFEVLWADKRESPFDFSHVTATYVTYSMGDQTPRAAWCLLFKEKDDANTISVVDPVYGREYLRKPVSSAVIIDDESNVTCAATLTAANANNE